MTWQTDEIYRCVNADCKSKILVLQSPRSDSGPFTAPRCVCGHDLQRLPYGVQEPLRSWTF